MVPKFLSIMWCGEPFHWLGIQDVKSLILVGALFLLDGGRRRGGIIKNKKEEEKISVGKEGFPSTRPTLLAVQQVTAVRSN
jgi:hypothetical protein